MDIEYASTMTISLDIEYSRMFHDSLTNIAVIRVVSSEISRNFWQKISGNLLQCFQKFAEIC